MPGLIDLDTAHRLLPMQVGESEVTWRARCMQEGTARFTTRQALRSLHTYRELVDNAAATSSWLVEVPAEEPVYSDGTVASAPPSALTKSPVVITVEQAKDMKLLAVYQAKALHEHRELVITDAPPETSAPPSDGQVIEVSATDWDNPAKYSEARARAIREKKMLRRVGGGF